MKNIFGKWGDKVMSLQSERMEQIFLEFVKDIPLSKWKWSAHLKPQCSKYVECDMIYENETTNEIIKIYISFIPDINIVIGNIECQYMHSNNDCNDLEMYICVNEQELQRGNVFIDAIVGLLRIYPKYKYIEGDYKQYCDRDIVDFIRELTEENIIYWKEDTIREDAADGTVLFFDSEYGDGKWCFVIEQDIDECDDIVSYTNQLEICIDEYLCLTYYDLPKEIEEVIQYGKSSKIITIHDFLVRTTNYVCVHKGHQLLRVEALVAVQNAIGTHEETVEAAYCVECDKYFILEHDYARLKQNGRICCRVITLEDLESNGGEYRDWAKESTLKIYGYSVNAKDNLTDNERQDVLSFIIENNIETENQVIQFLSWLIEQNKSRRNMENAVNKWERDINFVRNYQRVNKRVRVRDLFVRKK